MKICEYIKTSKTTLKIMTSTKEIIDTIEEQIKAQQLKLAQLKARKAKIEALRKSQDAKKDRLADTRRKILLGAYLQSKMEKEETTRMEVNKDLQNWLSRPDDRQLFGLVE